VAPPDGPLWHTMEVNNGRNDSYFTWLATSNEGDAFGL